MEFEFSFGRECDDLSPDDARGSVSCIEGGAALIATSVSEERATGVADSGKGYSSRHAACGMDAETNR